jgi:hypothetical protein
MCVYVECGWAESARGRVLYYFTFSYSALACFRMGMSGIAYCQWAKKSR